MNKLYKQFNRLNFDMDIEPMEVNDLEKERIKQTVLEQKKTRLSKTLSVSLVAIVTMIALSITVSLTNPALAAKLPIIGNIFELFKEDKDYIFDEYSNHATGIGTTQESNGITITITDAVYDTESITISYTMKSNKPLGDKAFLDGSFIAEEYKKSFTPGSTLIEKINDNEYAVVDITYLMNGKRHDQVNVKWIGESIRRVKNEKEQDPIEGKWHFEFTLDALEAETREFKGLTTKGEWINVTLRKMTTTPVATNFYLSIRLDKDLPQWEGEWETAFVDYLVSDDLGNEYNVMYNSGFGESRFLLLERFSTTVLHEEAASITITPVVFLYKLVGGNDLELVEEPFELESFEVKLDK